MSKRIGGNRHHNPFIKMVREFKEQILEEKFTSPMEVESLPESLQKKFYKKLACLNNNKCEIRKCENCGRIAIVAKMAHRFSKDYFQRHYWCFDCKRERFGGEKKFWHDESLKVSDKLQPAYRKIWDEYYRQKMRGVKVYYE